MLRFLAIIGALAFGASASIAETFMGRDVDIIDGRHDLAKSAPLIVAMHGFLGNAANMRKKTRFNELATREGLIVAYPNGVKRRWNDGRSPGNKTDDVGYMTALIGELVDRGSVDPKQVFLAGHSNGGGMAMRLACERPKLIRGISVVATKSPSKFQCGRGAPVPAIFFHGTEDPISPHGGRADNSRLGGALSSKGTLELWKGRNRCKGIPRTRKIDRVNDGTTAEIFRFSKCAAPVMYVLIDGHGHDWPSRTGRATRLQGPATKEVDATSLSWWFFKNL